MGPSAVGAKYILMFRDDHSNYCCLFAFPDTATVNAAIALIDWCAEFGVPDVYMSVGSTHFKNETLQLLRKDLKVPHHLTIPYYPWSNGAVERLRKELLCMARAVLSEIQKGFRRMCGRPSSTVVDHQQCHIGETY